MARPDRGRPAPQRACWGEKNPAAKLDSESVAWIRAAKDCSCGYAAKILGVHRSTVSAIRRFELWPKVGAPE
jgi:hypothetical protein